MVVSPAAMEGDQQHQGVRMGRGRALQMRLRKEKEERERRRKQQEEEEEKDGKEQQRLGAVPKQPGERSVGAVGGSSDLESLSQNMASLRTDGDSKLSARERILKFRGSNVINLPTCPRCRLHEFCPLPPHPFAQPNVPRLLPPEVPLPPPRRRRAAGAKAAPPP